MSQKGVLKIDRKRRSKSENLFVEVLNELYINYMYVKWVNSICKITKII